MLSGLKPVGQYDLVENIVAEYLNTVGMPNIGLGRIKLLNDVPLDEEYNEAA